MARKEEQLHDMVNGQIGFMRSELRRITLDVLGEMLDEKKLAPDQISAVKAYGEEVVKRYRAAMPLMQPEKE